jgi:hypothetical protein
MSKMKQFLTIMLLAGIFLNSCLKNQNSGSITVEKTVVEALPPIYSGCNLRFGTNIIIRKQSSLDSIFTSEARQNTPLLNSIEFSKYDLLVGSASYNRGIYSLEHHFFQVEDLIYSYRLYVTYDLTNPSGTFYYGILVDKLPKDANVVFQVNVVSSSI